ncbi:hypothetical protein D3C77_389950 [compost metagenome]
MGVKGQDYIVPVFHMIAHVFNLTGIDVWHGHGDGSRQVNNDLVICGWPPYIQHGITNFKREVNFGSGEALRRVLEFEVSFRFSRIFLQ